ncbi:hypothetical protein OGM63_24105 [Plectonema radiosum NIES-515]|uniref:Uncharacterized protein n=1 Tax=Plectonema radiosum NIES-515 TaxID=2986073 RepID=A0ABT3B5B0_9CYAN|nr:hypothetical protein [Plectonema radiosum]MCV3216556.1 hypothetical protein [Plectonema radiosum NIES-515]
MWCQIISFYLPHFNAIAHKLVSENSTYIAYFIQVLDVELREA